MMLPVSIKNKIATINNSIKDYSYMNKTKSELENILLNIKETINVLEDYSNQKIVELITAHYEDAKRASDDHQLTIKKVQKIDCFYQYCLKTKLNFLIYLPKLTRRINSLQSGKIKYDINQQLQHYEIIKNHINDRNAKKLEQFLNDHIIDFNLLLTNNICYGNLLILACYKGNLDVVKILINNNANIEYINSDSINPLLAALNSQNIDIAIYLLDMKANPDIIDNSGISGLIKSNIEPELFKNLIKKYHTNVNLAIPYGTILHYACEFFDLDSILFLLNNGAKVDALDSDQNSVLHILINQRNTTNINENIKIIKILLQKGININIQNIDGLTPLHCAIEQQEVEYIKILLDHGAKTLIKDNSGQTCQEMLNDDLWIDIFGLVSINNEF